MTRIKRRGITEIKIRLLPEKAKRDYVLRLVSSIIVMVFVILNFFIVFLPRRDLLTEINTINKEIYSLKSVYNNAYDLFKLKDNSIYNINNNNDLNKIHDQTIDINTIINDMYTLKPTHTFIESVSYNYEKNQFMLIVQCDTLMDLSTYQSKIGEIEYISAIDHGPQSPVKVPDGVERYKTTFLVTLDPKVAPKVGDSND